MIEFLEIFIAAVKEHPDRPAVVDRDGTRTTTYAELYSCAFKVNNWLRTHGIGREDVAAIYFPKGLEYIAARIGIMMSGAAWLGLEDIMGRDRIDFAVHDSGCKVVFDMEKWNEAM
ncbi:MAG: AMP-binding protein [Synergistaceae bacterium]|nr:AMP-binding protein [Synergistaceae bacterium]